MGDVRVGVSTTAGRGVFADRVFAQGELIERCPVLVVPAAQRPLLDETVLYDYYFEWSNGDAAFALGLGSLYNHTEHPNAMWEKNFEVGVVDYRAVADISVGEEILVRYGDADTLWFVPV